MVEKREGAGAENLSLVGLEFVLTNWGDEFFLPEQQGDR